MFSGDSECSGEVAKLTPGDGRVTGGGGVGVPGATGGGGEGGKATGGGKVTCFLAAEASPATQASNKMQATFIVIRIVTIVGDRC